MLAGGRISHIGALLEEEGKHTKAHFSSDLHFSLETSPFRPTAPAQHLHREDVTRASAGVHCAMLVGIPKSVCLSSPYLKQTAPGVYTIYIPEGSILSVEFRHLRKGLEMPGTENDGDWKISALYTARSAEYRITPVPQRLPEPARKRASQSERSPGDTKCGPGTQGYSMCSSRRNCRLILFLYKLLPRKYEVYSLFISTCLQNMHFIVIAGSWLMYLIQLVSFANSLPSAPLPC